MSSEAAGTRPISLFLLGGCDIHAPMFPLTRAGTKVSRSPYGHVPFTFTFGEMFQVIEVLRGQRDVPAQIRPLCLMDDQFGAVSRAADFADVDVFLVEPASSVDLVFRGCNLNRIPLSSIVLHPLRQIGKDAAKLANHWLKAGLAGQHDEKRSEVAEQLISMMPDDIENAEFIRSVLRESSAAKVDVRAAFTKLQNLLNGPIGVVNFVFRYLPDGRAVSWPAGHQEEILNAARALDLPVFDPAPIVREHGVLAVLKPEAAHYTDEFEPVMGERLADFAHAVFDDAGDMMGGHSRAVAPADVLLAES